MQVAEHDVLVIGAGGAGLRAAIEASGTGAQRGPRHQVAARQGAHRDGGGRDRRRPRQRGRPRRLEDPLRGHHAGRPVRGQPDDGRAPRPGSAGPGPGTGGLGGGVRPHDRPENPPAQLRRPQVPAARARRGPDRAGDDPHPPGPRDPSRDRRPHGVDGHGADHRWRPGGRGFRLRPREGALPALPGVGGSARHRRDRAGRSGSPPTVGNTPATATRSPTRRGRTSSTWSTSSSTRPGWSGRRASGASW